MEALHRTFEFIQGFHFRFTWAPGAQNFAFFPRVHVMCVLCVVTVMLLCWILHALHEDSSDGKNQCPTIDVVLCENCAMGKGRVLEVA